MDYFFKSCHGGKFIIEAIIFGKVSPPNLIKVIIGIIKYKMILNNIYKKADVNM